MTASLRRTLAGPDVVIAPGCWDALSARAAEQAGYPAVFAGGFAIGAARLALPDIGLTSFGEMLDAGDRIAKAVRIPLVLDGDTGHGNERNVRRTVLEFAAAGVAGLTIEDQVAPKRCGHQPGVEVVARDAALVRLRAAVDARERLQAEGGDVVIAARTDALAAAGEEEAVARAVAFAAAGADLIFVEGASPDLLRRLAGTVPVPLMASWVEGRTRAGVAELAEAGARLVIAPVALFMASLAAIGSTLAGLDAPQRPPRWDFDQANALLRLGEHLAVGAVPLPSPDQET